MFLIGRFCLPLFMNPRWNEEKLKCGRVIYMKFDYIEIDNGLLLCMMLQKSRKYYT